MSITTGKPLSHTSAPWEIENDMLGYNPCNIFDRTTGIGIATTKDKGGAFDDPNREGGTNAHNATLITMAPSAPHVCSNPKCPGNINRLKLAAWEQMKIALEESHFDGSFITITEALSRAERAERGEE